MSDESIRGTALANNIAARLRCCSILELQVIDRALGSLEGIRERDAFGRRWERRIATGPGDVDRSWHLVRPASVGFEIVRTSCNGAWNATDPVDSLDSPPLDERCGACWREAVQGDALGLALIDAVDEIAARERAKAALHEAALHEAARDEMVPRVVTASSGPGGPYLLEPIDPPIAAVGTTRAPGLHPFRTGTLLTQPEDLDRGDPTNGGDLVRIGLPGDDMGAPIAVDSDAPAATYRPAIRVADDGEAPDELGEGD